MKPEESQGLRRRRQVMGNDFVDRALSRTTEFSAPLQEFVCEHAWGTVWCRDGLDLKSRSLITVAMLVALGRTHELAGHLRGALNNGVSPRELQECLLHAAIYCGVPAAAEAFRCAEEICAQPQAETEPDVPLAAAE